MPETTLIKYHMKPGLSAAQAKWETEVFLTGDVFTGKPSSPNI
jgi:hypothetical protein